MFYKCSMLEYLAILARKWGPCAHVCSAPPSCEYQHAKQIQLLINCDLLIPIFTNTITNSGADPGGGVFGVWRPPPPQHIREAKRMMCCYKNT